MKSINKQKHVKKITYIVIILMLCNFIFPNYNYAVSTEGGGSLLGHIAKFVCFIPDVVNDFLQNMFVTPEKISEEDEYRNIQYSIKYSSGIIFSGQVPAFDINFIKPGKNKLKQAEERFLIGMDADPNVCIDESMLQIMNELGYNEGNTVETTTEDSIEEALSIIKSYLDDVSNWNMNKVLYDIKISEDTYDLYCNAIAETARWQWHFEKQNSEDMYNPEGWVSEKYCEYDGDICNQNDVYNSIKLYLENKYGNVSDEYKEKQEEIKDKLQKEMEDLEYGEARKVTFEKDEKTLTLYITRGGIQVHNMDLYQIDIMRIGIEREYSSSAAILQPVVATWYNALRRIALVGILSVLVYIGIRILLSSTSAKDKAKYKNMLKDWLVALCLLFVLHYIMSITITVVDKITEIIQASTIGADGEDILMSSVRNEIANSDNWSVAIAYVVIYCVLTVYTIIFTIQYIRRVIYIAFLTTIAPLITLTYPLDKIKDSKSQAFDMWLKDYIFFSLIQVLHLLLYYIFVGSAINLTNKGNWIYAIVAIGFLTPAEKIMKKMFGFEKSKSMGALAAGATGALVMNAINKLPHGSGAKGSKGQGGSQGGNPKTVRTATTKPLAALTMPGGGSSGSGSSGSGTSGSGSSGSGSSGSGSSGSGSSGSGSSGSGSSGSGSSGSGSSRSSSSGSGTSRSGSSGSGSSRSGSSGSGSSGSSSSRGGGTSSTGGSRIKPKRNIAGGITALGKRYMGPALGKGAGLFLGGAGAIIGFSVGVAQGDLGAAFAGAMVGGTAGYGLGQRGVDAVTNIKNPREKIDEITDTWREGAYGTETAQNAKFDREFRKSEAYGTLKRENPSSFSDQSIQKMLDAGITDPKKMDKILKKNAKNSRKYSIDKAIAYSTMAEKCPEDILYNNSKFIRFCQDRNIMISPADIQEMRKNIIEFK